MKKKTNKEQRENVENTKKIVEINLICLKSKSFNSWYNK